MLLVPPRSSPFFVVLALGFAFGLALLFVVAIGASSALCGGFWLATCRAAVRVLLATSGCLAVAVWLVPVSSLRVVVAGPLVELEEEETVGPLLVALQLELAAWTPKPLEECRFL